MKKKLFLVSALFALVAVGTFAQDYNAESDFKVKKEGNGVTITKYTGKATVVNIPPTIQNLPVTSIGQKAFYWNLKITSVTIPDSVTSIGQQAFALCQKLTSVTFQGTISLANYYNDSFPSDLRAKYLADGPGTYTRSDYSDTWTNQDAAANRAAAVTVLAAAAATANASQVDAKLNGRWRARARVGEYKDDLVEFSFLAGNYEILREYGPNRIGPTIKGTYATDAKGNIFLKATHFYNDNRNQWITIDELIKTWKSQGFSDALLKDELEEYWAMDMPLVYSITQEAMLQLYKGRETYTYFKQ